MTWKQRELNQWNRIERVKTDSCLYEQLIYEKDNPVQQQRKDIFIINVAVSIGYAYF